MTWREECGARGAARAMLYAKGQREALGWDFAFHVFPSQQVSFEVPGVVLVQTTAGLLKPNCSRLLRTLQHVALGSEHSCILFNASPSLSLRFETPHLGCLTGHLFSC